MTRYKDVYGWAAKKSAAHRYLMAISATLILWGVWFYGFYARYDRILDARRHDIVTLRAQKSALACAIQACCDEQKNIALLQEKIAPYIVSGAEKSAGSENNIAQARMIDIISASKKAGLSLTGCSMSGSLDKDWYFKHIIHVQALGSFSSLCSFLNSIKETKKMVQCLGLQLDREQDGSYRMAADFHTISCKDKKNLFFPPPSLL